VPSLLRALTQSAILGVSVNELFPHLPAGARRGMMRRVAGLRTLLEDRRRAGRATVADLAKVRWFDERWPRHVNANHNHR
jgi:hypothetical protein